MPERKQQQILPVHCLEAIMVPRCDAKTPIQNRLAHRNNQRCPFPSKTAHTGSALRRRAVIYAGTTLLLRSQNTRRFPAGYFGNRARRQHTEKLNERMKTTKIFQSNTLTTFMQLWTHTHTHFYDAGEQIYTQASGLTQPAPRGLPNLSDQKSELTHLRQSSRLGHYVGHSLYEDTGAPGRTSHKLKK